MKRLARLTPLRWLLYGVLTLQACSFSGCPEFDILVAMGCPDCPLTDEDYAIIANGIEEILEGTGGGGGSEESPGLPGSSVGGPDREPSADSVLLQLEWLCAGGVTLGDLLGGAAVPEEGVEQSLRAIRSAGFAVSPPASARSRLAGADLVEPRLVYMSNHMAGAVAVFDAESRSLLRTIPVGRSPRGIVITPDGAQVFVVNESSGRISMIDTATQTMTGTINLPSGATPYGLAITPDGATLLATDFNQRGQVHVVDVASEVVTDSIGVGPFPVNVAISPDGSLAYVANSGSNSVSVIDVRTRTRSRSVGVESPYAVAFHPTGNRFYVTSRTVPGQVFEIDTATDMILQRWDAGEKPEFLAVGSDGLRLYVTSRLSDFMNVISLLSGENRTISGVGFGLGPIALLPPRPAMP